MTPDDQPLRLAFLTNIPAPYKTPRLNALDDRDGVKLKVFYAGTETSRHRYEHLPEMRYEHETFPAFTISFLGREAILNRGVLSALRKFEPDAIVAGGWNYSASLLALLYSKVNRVPMGVLSENLSQESWLSKGLLRAILPAFDVCFAASSQAKQNLVEHGASKSETYVLPYCIDVESFRSSLSREKQTQLENTLEVEDENVVLYVGLLEERKGIDDLITAISEVDETHLLIAGYGPLREKLEAQAEAEAQDSVTFLGNVPNQELPNYYAIADVFVLPSRKEPWGLVLNEAMACGTPVVTTNVSGAVSNLVLDEETGLVVPPDDPFELATAIRRILFDEELAERLREGGLRASDEYVPERYAELIHEIIEQAR